MEIIEIGKVLDVYPYEGCVNLRVKGERTGIEYVGCAHQVIGRMPAVYENVAVERSDVKESGYAFKFNREGACASLVVLPA